MSKAKEALGDKIDEKLIEVIEILGKTKKYFGVVFDPNDDEMLVEMKRQIRIMEYDVDGKKRSRQQLRKRMRLVQAKLARSKGKAKNKAVGNS